MNPFNAQRPTPNVQRPRRGERPSNIRGANSAHWALGVEIHPRSQSHALGTAAHGEKICAPLPALRGLAALTTRQGFTLLEVIIAVMVLALTSLGIFRFVQSNIRAIKYSVDDTEQQLAVERLVGLVQEEFFNLPARGQATLLGESLKLNGTDFDSIEWRSRGGPGLMTTAASGEYQVKLRIQPVEKNSDKYEIGLWRRPALLDTELGLVAGGSDKDATWVPLLQNVKALRLRYWDQRLGQPLDTWRDPAVRPAFVIMSITPADEDVPFEAVLRIPSAQVR